MIENSFATISVKKGRLYRVSSDNHAYLYPNHAGKYFPGSRNELIEYMTDVGYQHIPDGHKVKIESMTDVGYHHIPVGIIGTFSETSGLAKKNKHDSDAFHSR